MRENYTEIVIEQVWGLSALKKLVNGPLSSIYSRDSLSPEKKKLAVLEHLKGTLFGTIGADVIDDHGLVYLDRVEIPKIVEIEGIRQAYYGSSDGVVDEEDPFNQLPDFTRPLMTRESGAYDKLLSDGEIVFVEGDLEKGVKQISGILKGATHSIGSFDQTFTSKLFVAKKTLIPNRAEKARDYLKACLWNAGLPESSYNLKLVRSVDPYNSQTREEILLLNTPDGLSLVFRPFPGPDEFSTEGTVKKPSGTAIYFNGNFVNVNKMNLLVDRYNTITKAKRGGLR